MVNIVQSVWVLFVKFTILQMYFYLFSFFVFLGMAVRKLLVDMMRDCRSCTNTYVCMYGTCVLLRWVDALQRPTKWWNGLPSWWMTWLIMWEFSFQRNFLALWLCYWRNAYSYTYADMHVNDIQLSSRKSEFGKETNIQISRLERERI